MLSKLTKSQGAVAGQRIGLVFDAQDEDAAPLLTQSALGLREDISWECVGDCWDDPPPTVEGAVAAIFWAGAFGGIVGFLRFQIFRNRGYPDHAVLHI